jgi:diadenosine tetraphosphate (Ap4A) HIT family hydrolase
MEFTLDERLQNDCVVLGDLPLSRLLLMNNALVPWFILVPKVSVIEIIDLTEHQQEALNKETNALARFVRENFSVEKMNVASIGNVVSQMHIHVVGRHSSDFCWPGVVWGRPEKTPYSEKEIGHIE